MATNIYRVANLINATFFVYQTAVYGIVLNVLNGMLKENKIRAQHKILKPNDIQ